MLIVVPVLCALVGFAVGRHTSVREPFYFIGTPVDLTANRVAPDAINTGDLPSRSAKYPPPEQLVSPPSVAEAVCGARTKSGKPCKRKVKGGGYCWQHRDGQSGKKEGSARQ